MFLKIIGCHFRLRSFPLEEPNLWNLVLELCIRKSQWLVTKRWRVSRPPQKWLKLSLKLILVKSNQYLAIYQRWFDDTGTMTCHGTQKRLWFKKSDDVSLSQPETDIVSSDFQKCILGPISPLFFLVKSSPSMHIRKRFVWSGLTSYNRRAQQCALFNARTITFGTCCGQLAGRWRQ